MRAISFQTRWRARVGRKDASCTTPHPALALPPQWALCCSKQDKSKSGLGAKLSGLSAPGSVLYIYCLGTEEAAGCTGGGDSAWDFFFFFHLSWKTKRLLQKLLNSTLFNINTEEEETYPGREKPVVLNMSQQVLLRGSRYHGQPLNSGLPALTITPRAFPPDSAVPIRSQERDL